MSTIATEGPSVRFYRTEPELYDALYHARPKNRKAVVSEVSDAEVEGILSSAHSGLSELRHRLAGVNLFRALNCSDYELRHSAFLAWLLDPSGTHGLGGRFLTAFADTVSAKRGRPAGRALNLNGTVEVIREKRFRVDVLVLAHGDRRLWAIENKVHAEEHNTQLQRYWTEVRAAYPDYAAEFVLLAPDERTPSQDAYVALSYEDVAVIIDDLLRQEGQAITFSSTSALNLLWRHYHQFLGGPGGHVVDLPSSPNLFQVLGLREIKHSAFWAWLFDPRAEHGLRDQPLRQLLSFIPTLAGVNSLKTTEVVPEKRNNLDLLLINHEARWVVAIENKLDAREGTDQLGRYRRYVENWFPEYHRGFVFLTRRGDPPSDSAWVRLSQGTWQPFFADLSTAGKKTIPGGSDVALLLSHYRDLLLDRLTYFQSTVAVPPPRLRKGVIALWESQPRVLGGIMEAVKRWQVQVRNELEALLLEAVPKTFDGGCIQRGPWKGHYRAFFTFVPHEWEELRRRATGSADGQFLNLTFVNLPFTNPFQNAESPGVSLIIGLNPPQLGWQELRERVYAMAGQQPDLFNNANKKSGPGTRQNVRLGVHNFVTAEECRRLPVRVVKERLHRAWADFRAHQYPRLVALLDHPSIRDCCRFG